MSTHENLRNHLSNLTHLFILMRFVFINIKAINYLILNNYNPVIFFLYFSKPCIPLKFVFVTFHFLCSNLKLLNLFKSIQRF